MKAALLLALLSTVALTGCGTMQPAGSAAGSSGQVNASGGLGLKF